MLLKQQIDEGHLNLLRINLGDPDFYAEWTPENNDGRLIKIIRRPFLAEELDLPDHMQRKGLMNLGFTLYSRKNYQTDIKTEASDNDKQYLEIQKSFNTIFISQSEINQSLSKLLEQIKEVSKLFYSIIWIASLLLLILAFISLYLILDI